MSLSPLEASWEETDAHVVARLKAERDAAAHEDVEPPEPPPWEGRPLLGDGFARALRESYARMRQNLRGSMRQQFDEPMV